VATYARLSTEDQAKHGYSLPWQTEAYRKYAKERGWTVVTEISDDGVSGATLDRPGLDRIRDMAHAGEIDAVIVYDVDRLGRKAVYHMLIEEELGKAGVTIHYVLGDYRDEDEGRLQRQIRAATAEHERAKFTERLVRGRPAKVKAGNVLLHSTPPNGYQRATDPATEKNTLAPFEPEAGIVGLVLHSYAYRDDEQGPLSMRALAKKLTEMRVPTRLDTVPDRGGSKKQDHGHWHPSTIGKLLSNKPYVGTWHYGKGHNAQNPRRRCLPVEVLPLTGRRGNSPGSGETSTERGPSAIRSTSTSCEEGLLVAFAG